MSWNEFHVTTSADYANALGDELISLGAQAVTFKDAGDQPIYEPSPETPRVWQETIVVGLFDSAHPVEPVIDFLKNPPAPFPKEFHFEIKPVADENWERRCLDNFNPIQCGKRLWICPSWHTPPVSNAANVILDPGLAFGTGTHPTTSLCLEWLDQNIEQGVQVIDYGTGSGILAIAAIKLGANQVIAVDNDPQALEATVANAERNHIGSDQLIVQLHTQSIDSKADILIANILAQPLIELAPYFSSAIKKSGKIVLSGILSTQVQNIVQAYEPWFLLDEPAYKEDWTRLSGTRK